MSPAKKQTFANSLAVALGCLSLASSVGNYFVLQYRVAESEAKIGALGAEVWAQKAKLADLQLNYDVRLKGIEDDVKAIRADMDELIKRGR